MTLRTMPWLVLLVFAAGCQATEVTTVWKTPDPLPPPFAKIAVVVVNASPAERRAGETELARILKPGQGVPSFGLIPDGQMSDRQKVREAFEKNGIDGVVVLRLVAADKTTTYYPPTYHANYGYYDYYDAYMTTSPGYTTTDTTIKTEISIYSVKDAKLLWAGAGNTLNPSNIQDLVEQLAKAAGKELREQGMLR